MASKKLPKSGYHAKWENFFTKEFEFYQAFNDESKFTQEDLEIAFKFYEATNEDDIDQRKFYFRECDKEVYHLMLYAVIFNRNGLFEQLLKDNDNNRVLDALFRKFYVDNLDFIPPRLLEKIVAEFTNPETVIIDMVSYIRLGVLLMARKLITPDQFKMWEQAKVLDTFDSHVELLTKRGVDVTKYAQKPSK